MHKSRNTSRHDPKRVTQTKSKLHQSSQQHQSKPTTPSPTQPHKTSTRHSHTTTPSQTTLPTSHFKPFQGKIEFTTSTHQLHLPVGSTINVSQDEVNKLSRLAYLAPHSDTTQTVDSVHKMVNWLSSITHINTKALPHTRQFKQQQAQLKTTQQLYTNDPAPIPFYTPLLLTKHVSPSAMNVEQQQHQSTTISTTTSYNPLNRRQQQQQRFITNNML
jgi:hypothetical protein